MLPIDQGLEHGPMDFFVNPDALDPDYQFRLARDGKFSAIALHIGLAEKYFHEYAGDVPLILKLNGKTSIPPDNEAFSALTGTVEDAVRLGADAVGYTIYVGSPAQDRDFDQFLEVRQDAQDLGMPVIVWAYPRGDSVAKKGGKESLFAIDYAARVALELGADVVKVNYPVPSEKDQQSPPPYNTLKLGPDAAFRRSILRPRRQYNYHYRAGFLCKGSRQPQGIYLQHALGYQVKALKKYLIPYFTTKPVGEGQDSDFRSAIR